VTIDQLESAVGKLSSGQGIGVADLLQQAAQSCHLRARMPPYLGTVGGPLNASINPESSARLAEGHLTRPLFGGMLRRIATLPAPAA
jgi:hypothetical protein